MSEDTNELYILKEYTEASRWEWFLAKIFGQKDSIIDPEELIEIDYIVYKNRMYITDITKIDEDMV